MKYPERLPLQVLFLLGSAAELSIAFFLHSAIIKR